MRDIAANEPPIPRTMPDGTLIDREVTKCPSCSMTLRIDKRWIKGILKCPRCSYEMKWDRQGCSSPNAPAGPWREPAKDIAAIEPSIPRTNSADRLQESPKVFASGPATIAKRGNRFGHNGRLLAVNSCPACKGTLVCQKCIHRDPSVPNTCECGNTSICQTCGQHVEVLEAIVREVSNKDFGPAEARIHRRFEDLRKSDQDALALSSVVGGGIGALVGSLFLPVLGTFIGAQVGSSVGRSVTESTLNWQRADLHFALGLLYGLNGQTEASRRAWISALTFKEDHEAARAALKAGFQSNLDR